MRTDIPGQLNGALPAGARLDTLRGTPQQAGDATVTPIARRLTLHWPGGGLVYAWPTAVEVQTERGTRRTRIISVRTVALATLAGVSLAALAALVTQRWLRQRMERAESANDTDDTRGAKRDGNDE